MYKVPGIKLVVSSLQSNGTIDSDKLVSAQHTRAILSIGARDSPGFAFTNSVGNMLCRITYFLRTRPITRSTWILTFAIFLVSSTSCTDSCFLPLVTVLPGKI